MVQCWSLSILHLVIKVIIAFFFVLYCCFSLPVGIIHGIQETEVEYIITSKSLLHKLIRLKNSLRKIKQIILLDNLDNEIINKFNEQLETVKLNTFAEILQSGEANFYHKNPVNIDQKDLAIIMYTSGIFFFV